MRMRIDGLGEFEEVVHFIPNGLHALLGQTSFLQKVEGFFFNCTTTTRRFGLYVKGNADVPKLQSVR